VWSPGGATRRDAGEVPKARQTSLQVFQGRIRFSLRSSGTLHSAGGPRDRGMLAGQRWSHVPVVNLCHHHSWASMPFPLPRTATVLAGPG